MKKMIGVNLVLISNMKTILMILVSIKIFKNNMIDQNHMTTGT